MQLRISYIVDWHGPGCGSDNTIQPVSVGDSGICVRYFQRSQNGGQVLQATLSTWQLVCQSICFGTHDCCFVIVPALSFFQEDFRAQHPYNKYYTNFRNLAIHTAGCLTRRPSWAGLTVGRHDRDSTNKGTPGCHSVTAILPFLPFDPGINHVRIHCLLEGL